MWNEGRRGSFCCVIEVRFVFEVIEIRDARGYLIKFTNRYLVFKSYVVNMFNEWIL